MRQLGWKPQIATHSVDTALGELGADARLDEILRVALQSVPHKGLA
jgi:hypothetical protein